MLRSEIICILSWKLWNFTVWWSYTFWRTNCLEWPKLTCSVCWMLLLNLIFVPFLLVVCIFLFFRFMSSLINLQLLLHVTHWQQDAGICVVLVCFPVTHAFLLVAALGSDPALTRQEQVFPNHSADKAYFMQTLYILIFCSLCDSRLN